MAVGIVGALHAHHDEWHQPLHPSSSAVSVSNSTLKSGVLSARDYRG